MTDWGTLYEEAQGHRFDFRWRLIKDEMPVIRKKHHKIVTNIHGTVEVKALWWVLKQLEGPNPPRWFNSIVWSEIPEIPEIPE